MTQNDLLKIAMPLVSLSNKEWDVFNELLENTEPETELHKVLTTLCMHTLLQQTFLSNV